MFLQPQIVEQVHEEYVNGDGDWEYDDITLERVRISFTRLNEKEQPRNKSFSLLNGLFVPR